MPNVSNTNELLSSNALVSGDLLRRCVGRSGLEGDTGPVGFDPQRRHRRRPSDLVFVAAGLMVVVIAVAWALFG